MGVDGESKGRVEEKKRERGEVSSEGVGAGQKKQTKKTQKKNNKRRTTKSIFPVFLDGEAPLPGQVVVFVVVRELGLDHVGAAGQHPLGGLLDSRQVLVGLVGPGAVAPYHVLRLVHCGGGEELGVGGAEISR